jgi:hypothetical protein
MRINLYYLLLINLFLLVVLYLSGYLLIGGLLFVALLVLAGLLAKRIKIVFWLLIVTIFCLPWLFAWQDGQYLTFWGYVMMILMAEFCLAKYLDLKRR